MRKFLLLILILTGCATHTLTPPSPVTLRSLVKPKYGLDILGLAKQDCNMIQQELDPGSAIGVLDGPNTFGDPRPCLDQLIANGKVAELRIQLIDGTVNNHQCSANENLPNVINESKKWALYCSQHPGVKCYASPFLEWGCEDSSLFHNAFNALNQYFPEAIPVCSSLIGGCPSGATKKEGHGNIGSADIRSNDGNSLFDAYTGPTLKDANGHITQLSYRDSGNTLVLGWTNCMNGRVSGEHQAPPPPLQRKNWCTRAEIRQIVRIMREPQPKPMIAGCSDINPNQISKTNAEYYGVGKDDGRGNKGLLILKGKYPRISIRTLDDKEVGHFTYFDPYLDGRQRHYIGHIGSNQSPVQLMDQLGGEWGKVIAGNSCLIYNAIRRLGSFH